MIDLLLVPARKGPNHEKMAKLKQVIQAKKEDSRNYASILSTKTIPQEQESAKEKSADAEMEVAGDQFEFLGVETKRFRVLPD